MCFKWGLGLVSVAILFVLGCGLNTGESAPEQSPASFGGKDYSCVGEIPSHVGRYAADELSDGQITEFVRCLQKSFSTFVQRTRGRDEDAYAPEEIRRFLQSYFFRERPISLKLTNEFMVLKQVLVGGRLDSLTRRELHQLIDLLEDVRREAIRLRPHIKYLNPQLVEKQGPVDMGLKLTQANETLRDSIRLIAGHLARGQTPYHLSNLATLMTEFRDFVRWEQTFPDAHPVPAWINFFAVFKSLTLTPDEGELIQPGEWSALLQNFSRWYLAYVQYRAGVKEQPRLYGVGLQNTMHLAQEVFTMAEDALNRQPNKMLTMEHLKTLVTAVQGLQWVPERVRVNSVERALQAVFGRMFVDDRAIAVGRVDGLTLPTLALMRFEFYRWATVQMQLNSNFHNQARIFEAERPRVPSLQNKPLLPKDLRARLQQNAGTADWQQFMRVKSLARPLFNDNLDRVTLVASEDMPRFRLVHEFNNLSMMNLLRSAVGVMFRGYSSESQRKLDWNAGLKSEEAQEFYEDMRDLMIDLAIADPRNKNVGARAFIEGNLFTYAADGLNSDPATSRLSFVESMELLAFLYSGGRTATDMYLELIRDKSDLKDLNCEKGGALDLNGEAKVSRNCVREKLPKLVIEFGVNMPGLVNYLAQATPDQRALLAQNLVNSANSPIHSDKDWVERNEISIMSVVMHYMEAVLTRFDTNRDGILVNQEVEKAVPVFAGFIQRFAKDKLEQDISTHQASNVFLYILAYKQIPSRWDLLWFWRTPALKLDRGELSTVFRVIVAKIFETAPVEEPPRPAPTPAACHYPIDYTDLNALACIPSMPM